jgi:tRNA (guanine37-N1)-methyltransferase
MSDINSYKENLNISKNLKKYLPTSYDVIGHIALIKLPDNLISYKNQIADAFLQTYKHIRTVCLIKPVSGELRTRDIEVIGGEKSLTTIHKEYGAVFKLDVSKVYFSPRLANERKRIANMVKKNEVIVDMFTGVAPFPIIISKYSQPKIIYAIDKNKYAIEYARYNITRNKALDKIELIHEDSKNVCKIFSKKDVLADRIIMNLPFSSFDFFYNALKITSNRGIIHYYSITDEKNVENRLKMLEALANKNSFSLEISAINKIKSYSPSEFYIGIDITAKKK